jgi:hypothetical protein
MSDIAIDPTTGDLYALWHGGDSGAGNIKLNVSKRDAATKTWTNFNDPLSTTFTMGGILVTRDGYIWYSYAVSTAYHQGLLRKSSSQRSVTGGFASAVQIVQMDDTGYTGVCALSEEGENRVVAFRQNGTAAKPAKWNYWDGSSWTQGTAGAPLSLASAPAASSAFNCLTRSSLRGVFAVYIETSSLYRLSRFTGTGWTPLWEIPLGGVGAGDVSGGHPAMEKLPPPGSAAAGLVYEDLQNTTQDQLFFDMTDVSTDRFLATRIVSKNAGDGTDLDIQTAINNLPSGGGTVFVRAGTYVINSPIVINKSNVTIAGEGFGRTVIQAAVGFSSSRSLIEGVADDCDLQQNLQYITLSDIMVDCNGEAGVKPKAAILLGRVAKAAVPIGPCPIARPAYKVDNAILRNVKVYDCQQYGIKFEGGATTLNNAAIIEDCIVDGRDPDQNTVDPNAGMALGALQDSIVRNNIVSNCGRVGIDPDGCQALLIGGNHCFNNNRGGIYCEDTSGSRPPLRIIVKGNVVSGNNATGGADTGGIGFTPGAGTGPVKDCLIADNIIFGNKADGPGLSRGIDLLYGVDCVIVGNVVKNNGEFYNNDGTGYGIILRTVELQPTRACNRVVIQGNRCTDDQVTKTQLYGLYLDQFGTTDNITVVGNDFTGNRTKDVGGLFGARGGSVVLQKTVSLGFGSNGITVGFPTDLPNTSYQAFATPVDLGNPLLWHTTVRIIGKNVSSVSFDFGTAVPGSGGPFYLEVFVVR